MGKGKRITEDEIQLVKNMLNDDYSIETIARRINRNPRSISNSLVKWGIREKKYNKDYLYEVGQIVNKTLKIVERTRVKDGNGTTTRKGYVVQSLIYSTAPTYKISEASLKLGTGCAYKSGRKAHKENCLWGIKSIRDNIIDVNEAKNTTPYANNKILFKCSSNNCDDTKMMVVSSLVKHGYSCPRCSTGTSYPERFFTSYLKQYSIEHEYQVKFNDFKGYIFDYKIVLNGEIYLVETHGAQHYLTEDDGYYSVELVQKSDSAKREYARRNNINYIELDCRKSDFNFIKKQINKNKHLPNINKKDEAVIMTQIETSSKYDVQKMIELYTVDKLSTYQIAEEYNLSDPTVATILKRNNVKLRGKKRMVRCIETGVVYESGSEASRQTGIGQGNINTCCRGERKTSGGYSWEYVDEK